MRRRVVLVYALRNALLPVLTIAASCSTMLRRQCAGRKGVPGRASLPTRSDALFTRLRQVQGFVF